jgi:large repetitive protein
VAPPSDTINTETSQLLCVTLTDGCETPDVTHCTWIAVTPIPPIVLSADTVLGCDPFAVVFTLTDTTNGATIDWDFGDGIVAPGLPVVGHTYGDPGSFDIGITVHWPNGCDDTTIVHDFITVEPVPEAEFSWSPNPGSVYEPTIQFAEQSQYYATYFEWDFAGLDTAMQPNPEYTFPDDFGNTYPVMLVVGNYLGCTDTVYRPVEIADEFLIFVPNTFSPDGDGINEVFRVTGRDISRSDFNLMIFDRWGEMVYQTTAIELGWDGTFGGEVAKEGVYAWKLRARSEYDGEKRELNGHVTLLK